MGRLPDPVQPMSRSAAPAKLVEELAVPRDSVKIAESSQEPLSREINDNKDVGNDSSRKDSAQANDGRVEVSSHATVSESVDDSDITEGSVKKKRGADEIFVTAFLIMLLVLIFNPWPGI